MKPNTTWNTASGSIRPEAHVKLQQVLQNANLTPVDVQITITYGHPEADAPRGAEAIRQTLEDAGITSIAFGVGDTTEPDDS